MIIEERDVVRLCINEDGVDIPTPFVGLATDVEEPVFSIRVTPEIVIRMERPEVIRNIYEFRGEKLVSISTTGTTGAFSFYSLDRWWHVLDNKSLFRLVGAKDE